MAEQDNSKQLWKVYEKLPPELKEAIFSEETASTIYDICSRNGLLDQRISEVAKYVGRVFLGLLPPEELQETLEIKLELGAALAKEISREIDRFLFYPLKPALEQLQKGEITPPTEMPEITPQTPIKKPQSEKESDTYREPIEGF